LGPIINCGPRPCVHGGFELPRTAIALAILMHPLEQRAFTLQRTIGNGSGPQQFPPLKAQITFASGSSRDMKTYVEDCRQWRETRRMVLPGARLAESDPKAHVSDKDARHLP
jgi:hypothetical protein